MKIASIVSATLGVLGAMSCGGGAGSNPHQLWLANDMVETRVKLIGSEPPPF